MRLLWWLPSKPYIIVNYHLVNAGSAGPDEKLGTSRSTLHGRRQRDDHGRCWRKESPSGPCGGAPGNELAYPRPGARHPKEPTLSWGSWDWGRRHEPPLSRGKDNTGTGRSTKPTAQCRGSSTQQNGGWRIILREHTRTPRKKAKCEDESYM
jgi:hypothetical protein